MDGTEDLMTEELPDSYEGLVTSQNDLNLVKENAWKQALEFKFKSVLDRIITMGGRDISITLNDMFILYDISQMLLYKVRVSFNSQTFIGYKQKMKLS
jgi:hypothetical protein